MRQTGSNNDQVGSLAEALDAIRKYRETKRTESNNNIIDDGSVEIVLEDGVHQVKETVVLRGDVHSNVNVRGIGHAAISGGIPVVNWQKKQSSNKNISLWAAPLPESAPSTEECSLQLWRDGQRLTLARSETFSYAKASSNYIQYKPGQLKDSYPADALSRIQLVMYESWTASVHLISKIDATNHTAYLKTTYNDKWAGSAAGSRYYVQNSMDELDEVGEFFFDLKAKDPLIYLALDPSDNANDAKKPVVMPGVTELIFANGTASKPVKQMSYTNVSFTFAAQELDTCFAGSCDMQSADFLTTSAIHLRYAHGWSFTSVSVGNFGGYGIWFDEGTKDSMVELSHVYDAGAGGVRLGQGHVVDSYTAADWLVKGSTGNVVQNNLLEDGGHVYQEGCGVFAQNVADTVIAHNEIGHFRYTGISVGWTWGYGHTNTKNTSTRYNHIHHIGEGFLSDMGCVYTLGHQPDSEIRNNLCHDVQSYNYGGWAYYTDEGSRDMTYVDNIAMHTKCAGHHQHYGTDNVLENNIYYNVNIGDVVTPGRKKILMTDCDSSIRGSTHSRDPKSCPSPDKQPHTGCCCYPGCDQGKCSSFKFERNIVYQPSPYNGSIVSTTFNLGLINFSFSNNTYFTVSNPAATIGYNATPKTGHGESLKEWQAGGKDAGSISADPKFTSMNKFTLAPDSPALARGFKPIDTSQIGPIGSCIGARRSSGGSSCTAAVSSVHDVMMERAPQLAAEGVVLL